MKTGAARSKFGEMLKGLRTERDLTLRALGAAADIPFAYLSLIESGKRGSGAGVATKLADGLKLVGKQRNEFLLSAESTSTPLGRKRVASSCPAFLAELFARRLEQLLGVQANEIGNFHSEHLDPVSKTCSGSPRHFFIGNVRGTSATSLKPGLKVLLRSEKSASILAVIVHSDGRQSAIKCDAETF